jgi:hypothetical protein
MPDDRTRVEMHMVYAYPDAIFFLFVDYQPRETRATIDGRPKVISIVL